MRAVPGLIAFLIGAALLAGPWWSSTLPRSDYPLVIVLGAVFAAIGVFAALPESWPRLRSRHDIVIARPPRRPQPVARFQFDCACDGWCDRGRCRRWLRRLFLDPGLNLGR